MPKWRGASPIIYSVLFNDKEVGVSIMRIMAKQLNGKIIKNGFQNFIENNLVTFCFSSFDIGPIISQKSVPTPADMTSLELLDYLGDLSNRMVMFHSFAVVEEIKF